MATIKSKSIPAGKSGQDAMEKQIAEGLKKRREYLELSVADLAQRSKVSRAMISKIERREVSPTAALLGRLCNGLGITLSSLIASAEVQVGPPIARAQQQPIWRDPDTGLERTMISPLNTGSRMEVIRIELPAGGEVKYDALRHHFDQHLLVLQGTLTLTMGRDEFELQAGDCVRSRIDVEHAFANHGRGPCRYLVMICR